MTIYNHLVCLFNIMAPPPLGEGPALISSTTVVYNKLFISNLFVKIDSGQRLTETTTTNYDGSSTDRGPPPRTAETHVTHGPHHFLQQRRNVKKYNQVDSGKRKFIGGTYHSNILTAYQMSKKFDDPIPTPDACYGRGAPLLF